MANNESLKNAKNKKDDEFYTEYADIEREMNAYLEFNPETFKDKVVLLPCDDPEWSNFTRYFAQNFELLGLKKLISTSYANDKKSAVFVQLSLFEQDSPKYDKRKTNSHGKIFTLDRDINKSGKIDINDIEWDYLKGDGDFRSNEVKKLRDEADIIVTNPPFSLFREFLAWLIESNKQFIIIGNENDTTTKETFPLVRDGIIWLGKYAGDMAFKVPADSEPRDTRFWIDPSGQKWRSMGNICWYTNVDLKRRHTVLDLMTMEENLRYNKPLIKKLEKDYNVREYPRFENYNAIEVPRYDAIPKDYSGIMGVPITFLKKHNPRQFRIIGHTHSGDTSAEVEKIRTDASRRHRGYINGKQIYDRILIEKVEEFNGED
ncbi:MAG: adenine-specific methyltransferase EcoRI family protein [Bacilli bacterium]|nr:adenine-specific methyltransferase EcoRI family protein [Bacilli bacterium]MBQ7031590.1 adenine-specific methyltransferase EcoRI family protein [Bacilli bacterium]